MLSPYARFGLLRFLGHRSLIVVAASVLTVSLGSLAPRTLASPAEATNLAWCAGTKTCLQWSAVAGATSYRVYRGETASLGCDLNPHLDSCRDAILAGTSTGTIVTETPAAGHFYWYLVTAVDGTGEGSYGNATSGARQVNDVGVCRASCLPAGTSCSDDGDCCSTSCIGGHCASACCVATGASCAQNGDCCTGTCSTGVCTATCTTAAECPGSDTACRERTCTAGVCGVANVPGGTVVPSTPGDCHGNVCDGSGNLVSTVDDTDVPADDGHQCTSEICTNGTPSHQTVPLGSSCNQNGGHYCSGLNCVECALNSQCPGQTTVCAAPTCTQFGTCGYTYASSTTVCGPGGLHCDGAGACVQCTYASECPGADTACHTRTCQAGLCGAMNPPNGTVVTSPSGDCHRNVCDGSGNLTSVIDDTDLPGADSNQCTNEACSNGVPGYPGAPAGTPCSQGGGTVCNGSGSCVVPPSVTATTPADGTSGFVTTAITVTFSQAMNPATLSGQTVSGACSGSIQVSLDNFATCVAFSSASPAMSGGNTTATLTPQPGLLVNRVYKIRVTTAAANASGGPLVSTYDQSPGFTTTSPQLCDGSLVVTQVYGGGGMTGATYHNDFIEIRNRGTSTVSLTGYSVQYATPGGNAWIVTGLPSVNLLAGKYFLVQLFSSGAGGTVLPTPDATGTTDIFASAGKVALVSNTTALTGSCPVGGAIVDFVGYGAAATCNEGGANAPAGSNTTSVMRNQLGCGDINQNSTDFTAVAPNPRNSAVSTASCSCVVRNETFLGGEADFCAVQFPSSINVQTATATQVFGQVFETGVTEAAGANGLVRAQLGYGPPAANPQYQSGWTWFNAGYNLQAGNNDEYQASFTAPAPGSYRYVYRFSIDQGVSWTYCDTTAGDGGSGSNAGLTFDIERQGVLTSTP